MIQPNDGDPLSSMNEDALFGSGPANWNSPSSSHSQSGHRGNAENCVIYNQLHDTTMDGVGDSDRNAEVTRSVTREEGGNATGARPKVNNTDRLGLPTSVNRERMRNKNVKDKENKNSNIKKSNNSQQNGQFPAFRSENIDPSWQPTLRLVDYGNNTPKRNGNSVKQKKQSMNKNSALVHGSADVGSADVGNANFLGNTSQVLSTPDDLVCANDTESGLDDFLQLPAGLDPNADPSQISRIYLHARRPGHVIPPSPLGEAELEPNNYASIGVENTEPKTEPKVNRIHNNLWEGSKNCNVKDVTTVPNGAGFKLNAFRTDVETDSENLSLAQCDLPGFNRRPSKSSLSSEQIVQHFPGNNVSLNINGHSTSKNTTPTVESQITVPYYIAPEVSGSDVPISLDSLPSNLPTDFLFGEGNSDYLYAQQLQMEFDKQNADFQTQMQYDTFSSLDYLNLSPDQRASLPQRQQGNNMNRADGNTGIVLNDVYDPAELGDSLSDSLFLTHQTREPEDTRTISPDVRYDLPSHPNPSMSPSNNHCLRGRGQSLEDENLARQLAEEMRLQDDEELARHLQEQDAMDERSLQFRNHGNRIQNELRENSEPLYARFNRTWHRPLTVPTTTRNHNVTDTVGRGQSSTERPLTRRRPLDYTELEYLEHIPNEYRMLPEYMGQYEFNPDYMLDDYREDSLVSINRDPRMLATLLMERAPDMMIPNDIDLNDYEALWELAEGLGEVKRVGMEPAEILALPVHTYKGPTGAEDNKTDCLVCLSEFKKGEELRTLPCCHFYHVDCIDEWLKRNAICPVCRQPASQRSSSH